MNSYCDARYTLTPRSYIILNISLGLKAFLFSIYLPRLNMVSFSSLLGALPVTTKNLGTFWICIYLFCFITIPPFKKTFSVSFFSCKPYVNISPSKHRCIRIFSLVCFLVHILCFMTNLQFSTPKRNQNDVIGSDLFPQPQRTLYSICSINSNWY